MVIFNVVPKTWDEDFIVVVSSSSILLSQQSAWNLSFLSNPFEVHWVFWYFYLLARKHTNNLEVSAFDLPLLLVVDIVYAWTFIIKWTYPRINICCQFKVESRCHLYLAGISIVMKASVIRKLKMSLKHENEPILVKKNLNILSWTHVSRKEAQLALLRTMI